MVEGPDPMGTPIIVTADAAAARALHLLHRLIHHPRPGESVKAQIGRAAMLAGLDYERAREMWYGRAKILAHEIMQLDGRVAQREARVALLIDRLSGLADAPALPPDLRVADALALAEMIPGVEPWARRMAMGARALIVLCLLSTLPALWADNADARPVRRGGPAAVRIVKAATRSAGPTPMRLASPGLGVRHA